MRAGAMRRLAAFVAQQQPQLLAVCEMPPGDALSLATRFDFQWAYRGRTALFWSEAFNAGQIHDGYLPSAGLAGRRGFLLIEGAFAGLPCDVAAGRFSRKREHRIPELRFARAQLRSALPRTVFFAQLAQASIAFGDLGFTEIAAEPASGERIYARGFDGEDLRASIARV